MRTMTGKIKKILEEIHPLHIIREVQKWPALYVRDAPERANTHFKLKIWCEVAKELFPEWGAYTKTERDNKITDLMKKWRNLRDTFKRQVEIERKIREGHVIRKKVYVYYKHMAFLQPHIGGDSDDDAPAAAAPAPAGATAPPRRRRARCADAKRRALAAPAPPPAGVYLDDIDEDKHFLMSLIPSFKKMTEEEKLTAKVEILKAIKGVRSASSSSFNYQVIDSLSCNTELEVIRENDDIKKEMFAEAEPADVDLEARANSEED